MSPRHPNRGTVTAGDGAKYERMFQDAAALFREARFDAARRALRPLIKSFSTHAEVRFLAGMIELRTDQPARAVDHLESAAKAAPRRSDILNALGSALRRADRKDDAVLHFQQAVAIDPGFSDARFNLANLLAEQGRFADAAAQFDAVATAAPDFAEAHQRHGLMLKLLGWNEAALIAYRRACGLRPDDADMRIGMGMLLYVMGHFDDAEKAFDAAAALDPTNAKAAGGRGIARMARGRIADALVDLRRAIALDPDDEAVHSSLILAMHYSAESGADDLLAEARRWDARHGAGKAPTGPPPKNDRDPERRLRIGYLSPDFCVHPVGWFMAPVFAAHDKDRVEIFAYACDGAEDWMTARFRAGADHWRQVAALDNPALARIVRDDRIDILIDLAGHGAHNRLAAFALRPAPVQVSAGGVFGTTGVAAIDAVVSDRFETPLGLERWFSECVVRMPDDCVCYGPPEYAPDVAPPPALRTGAVTFGCFNNLAKLDGDLFSLWARILARVPNACLMLKTSAFDDAGVRDDIAQRAEAAGIDPARLVLEGRAAHADLLAAYGSIDIALDPLTYSGGLTTLEALWMGVPVVTLPGETFCSRHSLSHLSNVGLGHLAATNPDEYVDIAVGLAADPDGLAALRRGLRARMAASPVCNARRYTRNLENALRNLWRRWCTTG